MRTGNGAAAAGSSEAANSGAGGRGAGSSRTGSGGTGNTGTGGAGMTGGGGTGNTGTGGAGMASGGGAGSSGMRLRLARQARGFSQQQLAGMAAVSRQAVSAVEAGHSDPSLRVALAVARALGTTVEELFGPGELPPPVDALVVAPLGPEGARVTLAPMGESFVALPLAGATATGAGFLLAGGVAGKPVIVQPVIAQPVTGQPGERQSAAATNSRPARQVRQVRPIGPPRPTLVLAGCDPAMPLLETPLALLDPPVAFTWWPCGSQEALELAADRLVHVAGAHLRGASGEYNTGPARELLRRQGADVVGFCSWREGLVLRADLAGEVAGLGDVLRRGLRLVNREPGSEARRVLDRELARLGISAAQISGYATQATGHLQVAASIAAGLADAGVASEPAALAFGLAFVPLAAEHFDLVIPADQAGCREVQGLLKVLSSRWLLDQLASLPGYDPARCGEHVASL
jgi:putative molybdopterin biosynthesis protein